MCPIGRRRLLDSSVVGAVLALPYDRGGRSKQRPYNLGSRAKPDLCPLWFIRIRSDIARTQ